MFYKYKSLFPILLLTVALWNKIYATDENECYCYEFCHNCSICYRLDLSNSQAYYRSYSDYDTLPYSFRKDFHLRFKYNLCDSIDSTNCLQSIATHSFQKTIWEGLTDKSLCRVPLFRQFEKAIKYPFSDDYSYYSSGPKALLYFSSLDSSHLQYYHEYIERINLFNDWTTSYYNICIRKSIKDLAEYTKELNGENYHPFGYVRPCKEVLMRWINRANEDLTKHQFAIQNNKELLSNLKSSITKIFDKIQKNCSKKHFSIYTFYDKGLIQFELGNYKLAIDQIELLLEKANAQQLEYFSSEILSTLGQSYVESNLYFEAVDTLSKVIDLNPNKKSAYFQRALAQFELGQWDEATKDFFSSGYQNLPKRATRNVDFALGFTHGIATGITDGSIEFIPGILSSLQGLSHCIWAIASDPINMSEAFVEGVYDCLSYIQSTPIQNSALAATMVIIPELKEVISNWNTWNDKEQGIQIGHLVGKYGIDILLTCDSFKGIEALKRLKTANSIHTLEKLSSTTAQSVALKEATLSWEKNRLSFLKKQICEKKGFDITQIEHSISEWLGEETKLIYNKSEDVILLSNNGKKRVRFDFNNPHGNKPHMHIEEKINSKWKDASKTHRVYPKEEH